MDEVLEAPDVRERLVGEAVEGEGVEERGRLEERRIAQDVDGV